MAQERRPVNEGAKTRVVAKGVTVGGLAEVQRPVAPVVVGETITETLQPTAPKVIPRR